MKTHVKLSIQGRLSVVEMEEDEEGRLSATAYVNACLCHFELIEVKRLKTGRLAAKHRTHRRLVAAIHLLEDRKAPLAPIAVSAENIGVYRLFLPLIIPTLAQ
jgi:hypothetical protein